MGIDWNDQGPAREWWLPEMDHEAGCKDSAYDPRFGRVICQRVMDGETVRQITADPRMPSYPTLYRWLQVHPDFAADYAAAREAVAAGRLQARAWRLRGRERIAQMDAEAAGKRWWRRGRRSSYTPARGRAVCRMIMLGRSLSEIVARPRMPSSKVVYTWLKREAAFLAAYVEACRCRELFLEMQREALVDEAIDAPWRLRELKRKAAALEGRMGRLRPKAYKVVPRV